MTNNLRKPAKYIYRLLIISISFLFLLVITGWILLQYPSVQTNITQRAANYLSRKTGFNVHIGRVDIHWFDRLALRDIVVLDRKNDTLISGRKTIANFNFFSFLQKKPKVEEIALHDLEIYAKIHAGDSVLNLTEFLTAIKNLSNDTLPEDESVSYHLNEVTAKNCIFYFDNENKTVHSDTLDFNHLKFKGVNFVLQKLIAKNDSFLFSIRSLSCQETTNFITVQSLSCLSVFSNREMSFQNLLFKTGESEVNGNIKFTYNSYHDFSDFKRGIFMNIQLTESALSCKELRKFVPLKNIPDQMISIKGNFIGKTGNFMIQHLRIVFPHGSLFEGETNFDGLPDIHETFFDFKLNKVRVMPDDIISFGGGEINEEITKIGPISFNGRLSGFLLDFVSTGTFKTKLGNIITDMNFKLGKSLTETYYKGTFGGENLKIEKLDGKKSGISNISFTNQLEGTGLNPDSFRVSLTTRISELTVNGSPCKNISFTGTLDPRLLSGEFAVNDTNLRVNMTGSLSRKKSIHSLDITGIIHYAKPGAWWQPAAEPIIKTGFTLNFPVLSLENPNGQFLLNNFNIRNEKQQVELDTLLITFRSGKEEKNISVKSSLVDVSAHGNFTFSQLKNDVKEFINEIQLYFENKPGILETYYQNKSNNDRTLTPYKLSYQLKIKKTKGLFELLNSPFYISENSSFEGYFRQGITTILNVQMLADTVSFLPITILNGNADMTLSKLYTGKELVGVGIFKTGNLIHDKKLIAENFLADGNWHDHQMEFESRLKIPGPENTANISGNLALGDEGISGTLQPSYITYRREKWNLSAENKFTVTGKKIKISNLKFTNRDQFIRIEGIISENKQDELSVFAEGLRLGMLNEFFPDKEQFYSGKCNADLKLSQLFDKPVISGDIGVQNFMINNFLVGEVHGKSQWDAAGKKIKIDFFVDKGKENTLRLQGVVAPYEKNPLNLNVNLNNFNLNLLEPYTSGIVSEVRGNISADLTWKGTFNKPEINGIGYLKNSSAKVDYLNVIYYVNTTLRVLENNIIFENSVITDAMGNNGYINGVIRNSYSGNVSLDFSVRLENLMTLKTNSKINELYYGTVFSSGDMNIKGSMKNLEMDARVKTEKGTNISIPVNAFRGNEKKNYIRFVNQEDVKIERETPLDLSGLKMNFDVEVTPEAAYRIIFDEKTGDILSGNGRGELKLEIDTKGDFNIFGNLEIVKGVYNFTFQQFVNKEFLLIPGQGREITWSGKPEDAEINLRSEYIVNANVTGILEDTLVSKKLTSKRQDVHIIMDLTGKLYRPDISYSLDIPTLAQGETGANQFATGYLNELKTNEYEMNKQIFSLLVLRRLAPPREENMLSGEGGKAALEGGVQEFLSNQVSSWLSQSNPYVSVDLNLGQTFDEQALKELEVKLTASLFGGRMRLIREGDFIQTSPDESKVRSIAGDWSIEYDIAKNGKLKFRMYNKLNPFSVALENNYTTGFGLVHSTSFNKFSELNLVGR